MPQYWVDFYFSFKGRASRYDFNIRYALVLLIGSLAAALVDYAVWGIDALTGAYLVTFSNMWQLIVIVPTFAVITRRLHDMNMAGWVQIPVYILPMVGFFVITGGSFDVMSLLTSSNGQLAVLQLVFVYVVFFIMISVNRGTVGANKYGSDPLEVKHV